ncbi:MAG: ribonuclease E inhibitor RraB [Sphingopyxis sp.]
MKSNIDQVEMASETLRVFEEHGENFDDVRHVIHFFYGGNFQALSASLSELGYEVKPTVDNDGVVAERYEAIGEEWRTSTLVHLCELADSYQVEYDGWEAEMMRQPAVPPANSSGKDKSSWLSKIFGNKN